MEKKWRPHPLPLSLTAGLVALGSANIATVEKWTVWLAREEEATPFLSSIFLHLFRYYIMVVEAILYMPQFIFFSLYICFFFTSRHTHKLPDRHLLRVSWATWHGTSLCLASSLRVGNGIMGPSRATCNSRLRLPRALPSSRCLDFEPAKLITPKSSSLHHRPNRLSSVPLPTAPLLAYIFISFMRSLFYLNIFTTPRC